MDEAYVKLELSRDECWSIVGILEQWMPRNASPTGTMFKTYQKLVRFVEQEEMKYERKNGEGEEPKT